MISKKVKLTIPQYRERKDIFEALGYKEVSCVEKGINAHVRYEIDENQPHYQELRQFEKTLFKKGPSFAPIVLLVVVAFVFLSIFVILLAQQKSNFDLVANAFSFLLPAFLCLLLDVVYTYFYFTINRRIIERGPQNKQEILKNIEIIKSK